MMEDDEDEDNDDDDDDESEDADDRKIEKKMGLKGMFTRN
jgi:hypothetical protein